MGQGPSLTLPVGTWDGSRLMGDGFSISFSWISKAVPSLACPKDLRIVLCAAQGAEGSVLNAVRQQSSFSAETAKS